jgi:hypothetical protein
MPPLPHCIALFPRQHSTARANCHQADGNEEIENGFKGGKYYDRITAAFHGLEEAMPLNKKLNRNRLSIFSRNFHYKSGHYGETLKQIAQLTDWRTFAILLREVILPPCTFYRVGLLREELEVKVFSTINGGEPSLIGVQLRVYGASVRCI